MTKVVSTRAVTLAVIVGAGLALTGCQSVREATGVAKLSPDEFTVLTKAPLVIPPDYNLRPPQPGVGSRNQLNPDAQARAALFPLNAAEQSAALGAGFSDGERLLLTRSGALTVDPEIRRVVTSDIGQEDQGPEFAERILYPQGATNAQAQAATVAAGP